MTTARSFSTLVLLAALLALPGCATMTRTEYKMATSAALGAGAGAATAIITGGCVACATAVGGIVGVGTGYIAAAIEDE